MTGADADPTVIAREIALRKLTAAARTRQELEQAMRRKNVPAEAAGAVLDRLERVGLVDDEAFARDWVAARQQRHHRSRSALRWELQAKGVGGEHIESALGSVDGAAELSAARALAAKRAAQSRDLDPAVRDRRIAGALARRGFGAEVVASVLNELRDRLDAGSDA